MEYLPSSPEQIKQMLNYLQINDFNELFSRSIPEEAFFNRELQLPEPLSEYEVSELIKKISRKNTASYNYKSFLGGGAYHHFIPSIVEYVVSKPEFYTAYTPYQPEVSQGTLASIFEFQTFICELTGFKIANASIYDGGTALAEAVLMSLRIKKKNPGLIAVSSCINPNYLKILKTYLKPQGVEIIEIPDLNGVTSSELLNKMDLPEKITAVVTQNPNFFGNLEDIRPFSRFAKEKEALLIVSHEPVSLGLLEAPANLGADICVGEAQSFGNPLNFGGPYLGFLATKKEYVRSIPGRLVGQTVDEDGNRGYVMTLQTREQHIRREKATSNICTNEALCALAATVYLSYMGPKGLKKLARIIYSRTRYAKQVFSKYSTLPFKDNPSFKEFVLRLPVSTDRAFSLFKKKNILPGIPLKHLTDNAHRNDILVCITETTGKEDIYKYADVLKELS